MTVALLPFSTSQMRCDPGTPWISVVAAGFAFRLARGRASGRPLISLVTDGFALTGRVIHDRDLNAVRNPLEDIYERVSSVTSFDVSVSH